MQKEAPVKHKVMPLMAMAHGALRLAVVQPNRGAYMPKRGKPGRRLCSVSQGWCAVCGKEIKKKNVEEGGAFSARGKINGVDFP